LFGLAYGDALGAPTEFMSLARILKQFPPSGPRELFGELAFVTDDTQMGLAVAEALQSADACASFGADVLERELRRTFVAWMKSPDNFRAPGVTCMRACEALDAGRPWVDACIPRSKGCGANMRVTPVGLLPLGRHGLTQQDRAAIAQFQAALTHGNATGLAASDITAEAVADLTAGGDPTGLPLRLRDYATSQRRVYHANYLGTVWKRSSAKSPEDYIESGWNDCLRILDRLERALIVSDRSADPCLSTGEGWVAEEALGSALLSFLLFPDDPVSAISRAATSAGDSDSIACLAGAFAGAACGMGSWPADWATRIEYKDRLDRSATWFAKLQ